MLQSLVVRSEDTFTTSLAFKLYLRLNHLDWNLSRYDYLLPGPTGKSCFFLCMLRLRVFKKHVTAEPAKGASISHQKKNNINHMTICAFLNYSAFQLKRWSCHFAAWLSWGSLKSGGKTAANVSPDFPGGGNLDSGGCVVVAEFSVSKQASKHVVRSGRMRPWYVIFFQGAILSSMAHHMNSPRSARGRMERPS